MKKYFDNFLKKKDTLRPEIYLDAMVEALLNRELVGDKRWNRAQTELVKLGYNPMEILYDLLEDEPLEYDDISMN